MTHKQAKAAIDKLRMTDHEKAEMLRQWDERYENVRPLLNIIAMRQADGTNIHTGEQS